MMEIVDQSKKKTKRQRFLEVAQRRTKKTIKGIRLLAKCSRRSSYEYTKKDVQKIFQTIQIELEHARIAFESASDGEVQFTLDGGSEGGEDDRS